MDIHQMIPLWWGWRLKVPFRRLDSRCPMFLGIRVQRTPRIHY